MRLAHACALIAVGILNLANPGPATADVSQYDVHHHSGMFVVFQRNDEFRQVSTDGCMIGLDADFADRWREFFTSGPVAPPDYCITAFSAALQRGELASLIRRYEDPTKHPIDSAIALAIGFHDGFLNPNKYAKYLAAPNAMVQQLTSACLGLTGKRKDCLIAGAVQGIVERRFIERTPALRAKEFAAILGN